MRITVIGGTGHIGTYLVPRLVHAGHSVVSVSRGRRDPYRPDGAWADVETLTIDRDEAEADGAFGDAILDTDPDVVVDLICYERDSAVRLVEAIREEVAHLLHCGTLWVHGPSDVVPTTEDRPRTRRPLGSYGERKAAIERYLLQQARERDLPVTLLHPGHITGPGWTPINPVGNGETAVFETLAGGEEFPLPNFGQETLHHVHADDVAQAFHLAIDHRSTAIGEAFNVAAPDPVTVRGYAEAVARWFGEEPQLTTHPWPAWQEISGLSDDAIASTETHLRYSPHASIEKAEELLDFRPRYTALQAIREALETMIRTGQLDADFPAGPT